MGVLQYRVGWGSGGPNPGVSVFHARIKAGETAGGASQAFADRCRVFFDSIKTVVAGLQTWNFPGEVLELDTATGNLEDVHTITAPANVLSTPAGAYAAPAGARIEWRTTAIVAGRRLRGRTFIVPLPTGSYEANGSLVAATITTLNNAAIAFHDAGVFSQAQPAVYSRTHGVQADITSASVPDEATILRSRRD